MIGGKVFSVVLLVKVLLLLHTEICVSSVRIECIPLKLCPLAMKLIKTKPYAPETIEFLRYSHCGFDGSDPKIWCTLFLYCKTPDSRNGVCKDIEQCDAIMQYIAKVNRNSLTKKFLKEYRCSTDQDPEVRVCCPDEGKVTHIHTHEVHERFSSFFPDPDMGECGKQSSDNKIVGGTEAYLDEFPWLALFKYVNRNKVQYACAGSLIKEQYVLTAAHCVDSDIIQQKDLGKLQSIILGEYDIRNETDCIFQKFGEDCADPPQVFTAGKFIIHPNYSAETMVNDIAIVRLDRKAILSDYVQPICLPNASFFLKGNETFTISGWGRTETEKRSPIKRKAMLPYSSRKQCNKYNGRRKLERGQICVGNGQGVDSCFGDSGGPLMLDVKTAKGFASFAVGIVSYGYGQLCGSFPGVYTFLPEYIEWIDGEIK